MLISLKTHLRENQEAKEIPFIQTTQALRSGHLVKFISADERDTITQQTAELAQDIFALKDLNDTNMERYFVQGLEVKSEDSALVIAIKERNKEKALELTDHESSNDLSQIFLETLTDEDLGLFTAVELKGILKKIFSIPQDAETDSNLRSVFSFLCEKGHLTLAKKMYELNPDHLNQVSRNRTTSFRFACDRGHLEVAQWIYSLKNECMNETYESGVTPFTIACASGHLEIAKWIHSLNHDCLNDKLEDGTTPFLTACNNGHLEVAKWIHSLKSDCLNEKTNQKLGACFFALLRNNISILEWLTEFNINLSDIEITRIKTHFKNLPKDKQIELLQRLKLSQLSYLFFDVIKTLPDQRDYHPQFLELFPHSYQFLRAKPPLPKGDALVRYYDEKIKDIPTITNPFQDLMRIFDTEITEAVFHQHLNTATSESYLVEVSSEKRRENLDKLNLLFDKIRLRKKDPGVDLGKEADHYPHLEKILKHLAKHLESQRENKAELLTFFNELLETSDKCVTNNSQQLYAIYSRISGDTQAAEAAEEVLKSPSEEFLDQLKHELTLQIKKIAARFIRQDVHERAVVMDFLQEANIPVFDSVSSTDNQWQKEYALSTLIAAYRQQDPSARFTDDQFQEYLTNKIISECEKPSVFFSALTSLFEKKLLVKDHSGLLNQFTEWAGEKNIQIQDILVWDEDKEMFGIHFNEIHQILRHLPKRIEIVS